MQLVGGARKWRGTVSVKTGNTTMSTADKEILVPDLFTYHFDLTTRLVSPRQTTILVPTRRPACISSHNRSPTSG